jgi:transposase-like protein
MRRRSAFSTNSAQPWCVPARIVSAASSISTSRWMRPGWAVGRAARAVASIIKYWLPLQSKFGTPGTAQDKRRDGRCAGRVRPSIAADRSAESLGGFVKSTVIPGTLVITDDWSGYNGLRTDGYDHHPIAQCGDPEVSEEFMPIVHLVFSNLKTWLNGIHHGVSQKHLQAYLNEFTFRFNCRFYPFNAFRSLLGMAGSATAPTAAGLYSGEWQHPTCCRYGR